MPTLILNRNEVAAGPSPLCLKALGNFSARDAALYIDGYYNSRLVPELSRRFGVPAPQIMLGYGIEDLLRTFFARLAPGKDSVLTSSLHYYYYTEYLRRQGIALHRFRLSDDGARYSFDIDDCVRQYRRYRPAIVLIASPSNPTGNSLTHRELVRILNIVSRRTLIAVDQAYVGFSRTDNQRQFIPLLKRYPNLVLLRTFSKRYALAGLRIGFGLCGKNVKAMVRYQDYFLGMSRVSEAVAVAALGSESYYRDISRLVIADRERFLAAAERFRHIRAYDSNANFVLLRMPPRLGARLRRTVEQQPVVIGKFFTDRYLRVTVGNPPYTQRLTKLLNAADRAYAA